MATPLGYNRFGASSWAPPSCLAVPHVMHLFSQPADERPERIVQFPTRGIGEPDPPPAPRRRTSRPRRARRRGQQAPWLQRNALSIAAVSILVALLGLGFGLAQLLTRPEPSPAFLAVNGPEQAAPATTAATSASALSVAGASPTLEAAPPSEPTPRTIQATATRLEPNYTVEAGDTLGRIALRFNTTVERIQAFNPNLSDPRALRIGTKLVIPPPL